MQLRGGGADGRSSGSKPERQEAPALQRKAGRGTQNPVTDVQDNGVKDHIDRFECTINPSRNNRFEILQVQSVDWCRQPNATWHRTKINNGAPWTLFFMFWFRQGIPLQRRYDSAQYTWRDYFSLSWRLIPAGLATSVAVSRSNPKTRGDHGVLSNLNAKTLFTSS